MGWVTLRRNQRVFDEAAQIPFQGDADEGTP